MATFGMVGKFITDNADNRDALLDILSQAAEMMNDLEGCQLYVVSKDAEDDTIVHVMELWDSKAAHDNSLTLPAVRELITQAMPFIKGNEGASLIPVTGL